MLKRRPPEIKIQLITRSHIEDKADNFPKTMIGVIENTQLYNYYGSINIIR